MIDGNVIIGGVGHETVGVGGAATFVWLVLDRPATADQVMGEISATWPELDPVDPSVVAEALAVLSDRGLVETDSTGAPEPGTAS